MKLVGAGESVYFLGRVFNVSRMLELQNMFANTISKRAGVDNK